MINKKKTIAIPLTLMTYMLPPNISALDYRQTTCTPSAMENGGIYIDIDAKTYHIEDKDRDCKSDYLALTEKSGSLLIFATPNSESLGINAQNIVYKINTKTTTAVNIGSIPVSAEPVGRGQFRNIDQEGGALYQAIYQISETSIAILQPNYVFLFAESQCIYNKSHDKNCTERKGTSQHPICLKQYKDKRILTNMKYCAEMKEIYNQQNSPTK